MTRLADATWPDMADRSAAGCVLLLPFGSTEQHGPHLPVTTDTDIAVALAEGAARRDDRLLVAPAVAYGSSGEHQGFAGTLSIGQDATELVVVELGRSARVHVASTVVVSAHGGNAAPVSRAVDRLVAEGQRVGAWSPRFDGDLHAGRTETSLMLAIAPERVRPEHAAPGDLRSLDVLLPLLRRQGLHSISANGVLGDPTGATAEEGRRLLDAAIDSLLACAEGMRTAPTMEVSR